MIKTESQVSSAPFSPGY